MSSAIIRVKRKLEDNPVEAILLSYKRKKGNDDSDPSENEQAILKFTGTVKEKVKILPFKLLRLINKHFT